MLDIHGVGIAKCYGTIHPSDNKEISIGELDHALAWSFKWEFGLSVSQLAGVEMTGFYDRVVIVIYTYHP